MNYRIFIIFIFSLFLSNCEQVTFKDSKKINTEIKKNIETQDLL